MGRWLVGVLTCGFAVSGCSSAEISSDGPVASTNARQSSGPVVATLVKKLIANEADIGDGFGRALAIGENIVLAGLASDDGDEGLDRGAAFTFARGATDWQQQSRLVPLGLANGSAFGSALALEPGRAAITSSAEQWVFIYEREADTWQLRARLEAPRPQSNEVFGVAVALNGESALIGAPVKGSGSGSAYLFTALNTSWSEQAEFAASDALDRSFGYEVALDANVVVVAGGSATRRGSAYVFERTAGSWAEKALLMASDGSDADDFGTALELEGDKLYVGAPGAVNKGESTGAVYEFTRAAGAWTQTAKLAPETADNVRFGSALALFGDRLLVGAPRAYADTGFASYFERSAGVWSAASDFQPRDVGIGDAFGISTGLFDNLAIVGAPNHDGFGQDAGAAYLMLIGLPPGSACSVSSQCAGWCVDGMCCNKPCAAGCEVCRKGEGAVEDGQCMTLAIGSESARCAPLLCDGPSECPISCLGAGCAVSYYCSVAGRCELKRPLGTACALDVECESSRCVDERCCESVCTGCRACRTDLTGASDGLCAPVLAGTDPDQVCALDPGFPSNCRADGSCDGAGQCRVFAPPTTPCGPTSCVGDSVVGTLCNGLGGCGQGQASCAPDECRAGMCGRTCSMDDDCSESGFCTAIGVCGVQLSNGKACARARQCSSGHCVDGVCCNSGCTGQCEWCAAATTSGTCTASVGAAPPGRAPCEKDTPQEPCAAAQCDGQTREYCAASVGSDVVCSAASCVDGKARAESRCNGKGACSQQSLTDCSPYACSGAVCLERCGSDRDCANGAICQAASGKCSQGPVCASERVLRRPGGAEIDCLEYRCDDSAGACFSACSSALQCAEGNVCTSAGECRRLEPVGACMCSVPGAESGFGRLSLNVLLPLSWAVMALRRRRRWSRI